MKIDQVLEKLNSLLEDVSILEKNLPPTDFEQIETTLNALLEMVKPLKHMSSIELPPQLYSNLLQQVNNVQGVLNQIKSMVKGGQFQRQQLEGALNNLINFKNNFYNIIFPYVFIIQIYKDKLKNLENIEQKIGTILEDTQKQHKEISAIHTETFAGKVASTYGDIFNKQAQMHQKMAKVWLSIWVVFAISLAGLAFYFLMISIPAALDKPSLYILYLGALKTAIISVGFYMLYQFIKNYHAHSHLKTLNEHRHNAMKIFDIFLDAVEDSATRDAIVAHMVRYIFSDRLTGYLSGKEVSNTPAGQITEVIRNLATKE